MGGGKAGGGAQGGGSVLWGAAGGGAAGDALFAVLMQEVRHAAGGARLTARTRAALERLRPSERRALVSRTRDGAAPLLVAARRGNAELVEYLVHVCAADLEQRGQFRVEEDGSVHTVTPLWAAAVAGRLAAVRVLADAGADLDAASDSGSTPVRSACYMSHLDVVRFLAARGADVHRANHNGGTCLINAVQSTPLCAFLLQRGAAVDQRDMQLKTALHYAVQEHRVDTVRLLLEHGADPALQSRAGDDALRTACLKGAGAVVALLLARGGVAPDAAADAYELLGATSLDEFNDVSAALGAWRRATLLRHAGPGYLPKRPRPPIAALQGAREWRTLAELEAAATDMDALRTQALLVAERVLGAHHKDTLFRLMYRGAAYAEAGHYQRCIDLWLWALEIRTTRDSLLCTETCHTACALTRLMLDARGGRLERDGAIGAAGVGAGAASQDAALPRFEDAMRALALVTADLPASRRAVAVKPVYKKQAEAFERALRCTTHLLILVLETARSAQQRLEARSRVRELVALDVRSALTGDSLLHLAVSHLNLIRSTYFADEIPSPPLFPNVAVARLLLQCGMSPRRGNLSGSTALHVAALPSNSSRELVQLLLDHGAHLDQPNRFGDSPADLVALNHANTVRILQHVSLKCLAARAVLSCARNARLADGDGALPTTLRAFLDLHRASPVTSSPHHPHQ